MKETDNSNAVAKLSKSTSTRECSEDRGRIRHSDVPLPVNSILLDPRLYNCRRVFFQDIRREISIGVYACEMSASQEVIINLDVFVDCRDSTSNDDDLNDVFDYDAVHCGLIKLLDSRHFALQETLIDAIVGMCIEDHRVRAVRAMVAKTAAYEDVAGVGIEVFRFSNAITLNA